MEVLQVGTDVKIIDATRSGKISCVHIRENENVTYDIVFWIGHERKCEEFAPYEFKVNDNPVMKKTIGFNGSGEK